MRKRCCYCKRLFSPDPRQKGKQRTCGRQECKRRRRRDYGKIWREKNPDYDTSDYRKARRKDRRERKRRYWATHPAYRRWHAEYVRRWRKMKKLPEKSVKVPNPEIEYNYCKEGTYLKITSVRVPYPDIAPILFQKKHLISNYPCEGGKSR